MYAPESNTINGLLAYLDNTFDNHYPIYPFKSRIDSYSIEEYLEKICYEENKKGNWLLEHGTSGFSKVGTSNSHNQKYLISELMDSMNISIKKIYWPI